MVDFYEFVYIQITDEDMQDVYESPFQAGLQGIEKKIADMVVLPTENSLRGNIY